METRFLEIVYQDVLEIESKRRKKPYKTECLLPIFYKDVQL
ncbi:MAG: GxxExxY protein [bacterium]